MTQIVTRFAPSPTGRLHLGHAYSALFGWQIARAGGGRFLLRIEDIDPGRCRPEFEAGILEDLAWLGLDWETPVMRQSERLDAYADALETLDTAGLLYPCFCTRKDIRREIVAAGHAPHGPDGPVYPGICRHLSAAESADRMAGGAPYALRLRLDDALDTAGPLRFNDRELGEVTVDPAPFGDVVLARKDVRTSYHLAVVVDDAAQGVTAVTRGVDLRPATHLHRLLQHLLGLPVPAYAHHRLLTDADGRRFAKRDRAATIQALRESGEDPASVRALAGFIEAVD
ncbi:MAG: tRNA glutamyl-Q(34) synthetase GluQRS [Alphaproteobacteria bacterium]|nr:tRNA glutamyl-Q(34) synthetase GluQRS [Alphaproteobacteria bacterium]